MDFRRRVFREGQSQDFLRCPSGRTTEAGPMALPRGSFGKAYLGLQDLKGVQVSVPEHLAFSQKETEELSIETAVCLVYNGLEPMFPLYSIAW